MVLALESGNVQETGKHMSYPWNERPIIRNHTNKIKAYFYIFVVRCNKMFFYNWLSLLRVLSYVRQNVVEPSFLTTVSAATTNKCTVATVGQILTQT